MRIKKKNPKLSKVLKICSWCGYELKDVLEEEKSLGELLEKINILGSSSI